MLIVSHCYSVDSLVWSYMCCRMFVIAYWVFTNQISPVVRFFFPKAEQMSASQLSWRPSLHLLTKQLFLKLVLFVISPFCLCSPRIWVMKTASGSSLVRWRLWNRCCSDCRLWRRSFSDNSSHQQLWLSQSGCWHQQHRYKEPGWLDTDL